MSIRFNDCLFINIGTALRGCKSKDFVSTYGWSQQGEDVASIGLDGYLKYSSPYIRLYYTTNGASVDYTIKIVKKPSNLGVGDVYYFQCPHTGKLCRKLYKVGKYFLHREAYKNLYYDSQLESRAMRKLAKYYIPMIKEDEIIATQFQKNFKKFYRGIPTKRYQKILELLD